DARNRIELCRSARVRNCTVQLPVHQKKSRSIPMVSCCVIRIQLNRSLKLFHRRRELEILSEVETEGCVRFGECVVKLQRPLRGSLCPWQAFLRRSCTVTGHHRVCVGDACVGQRVVRIFLRSLLKERQPSLKILGSTSVPKITSP